MEPIILYFRQDLRLKHNFALIAAAKEKKPIIPIYIFDTKNPGKWQIGSANQWWLHHSLEVLKKALQKKNLNLILRKGNPQHILDSLVQETKACAIYWNLCFEPYARKRDDTLQAFFKKKGVDIEIFNSTLLIDPEEIKTKEDNVYKVFTPFWKTCLKMLSSKNGNPCSSPKLISYNKKIASDALKTWNLLPKHPNWAKGIEEQWTPGEEAAEKLLADFVKKDLKDYKKARDLPGLDKTSHLSPYLHMGEIHPKKIWDAVKHSDGLSKETVDCFLSELGWREFSYYLLYHFPNLPETPLVTKLTKFQWDDNKEKLSCWQKGMTGYPIVDAGMRQLWQIGWMHNRVRMIVASFLIKDLFIHWKRGEEWFWDTLVDADLANNSASWQWVAGCGADAAPYFRIFNPVLQGEKFDPEGSYVRKWVPELAQLPNRYIHQPWGASETFLKEKNIKLGKDYPKPIVDHKKSRKEALIRFEKIK